MKHLKNYEHDNKSNNCINNRDNRRIIFIYSSVFSCTNFKIMKTKRLEILENSLIKKKNLFEAKLQDHFATVKEANGQPLNDKRNGQATLNRWERQNNALFNLEESIAKTENAIEKERYKIETSEDAKKSLPKVILGMLESGQLTQWRKHPNTFFVKEVKKARIVWKNENLYTRYKDSIIDKEQWKIFAKTFNAIAKSLNNAK